MSTFNSKWADFRKEQKKEKVSDAPKYEAPKTPKRSEADAKVSGVPLGAAPTDTLPRLPWQLERLVSAASSDNLDAAMPGVHDLNRYTMAWAAAYLTGDRDEALARLWAVHRAWQELN
jgi:hypothetical protein